MERNPDRNKSLRELFILLGFQIFQVPIFPGKAGKGNYTSEDIYEKGDCERDFQ
jgi:hypothetical protein